MGQCYSSSRVSTSADGAVTDASTERTCHARFLKRCGCGNVFILNPNTEGSNQVEAGPAQELGNGAAGIGLEPATPAQNHSTPAE